MKTFYQMSGEDTMKQLNGSAEPLTESQVKEHQEKYGRNELVEGKKKTVLQIFLEQYKDFLVIILIIAAIASGFMGDVESTAVILIVITMNAILGTVQTVKAEQSLASLKKLSGPEAKVLRNGTVIPIPSSEVTVGDIVMLDAGDYIPADGRLLESASLKVDESALTGESLGVEKSVDIINEEEVPLGDRLNMVYSGSFVTYGRGSFVVTGIGMETEVGKIASLLKTTSEKRTPLQINLDQFGQKLSILILVFCGILFGINILRGDKIGDAFLFAVVEQFHFQFVYEIDLAVFSFAGYADLSGAHCLHRDRCKFTDAHAGAADDLDDHGKAEVAILFCSCDEFFVFGAHHLFFLRIDVVWLGLEDRDKTVVPACVSEEAV
mgnify:CR=1 FL=1